MGYHCSNHRDMGLTFYQKLVLSLFWFFPQQKIYIHTEIATVFHNVLNLHEELIYENNENILLLLLVVWLLFFHFDPTASLTATCLVPFVLWLNNDRLKTDFLSSFKVTNKAEFMTDSKITVFTCLTFAGSFCHGWFCLMWLSTSVDIITLWKEPDEHNVYD